MSLPVPSPWSAFQEALARLGLSPSTRQEEQLREYAGMLLEWGRALDLTAASSEEEVLFLHLLDSLLALPLLQEHGGQRLLDVGSGAGLPGVPLAIFLPERHWTLLEASRRKALFLERVSRRLGLEQVQVLPERAEVLAHRPEHREGYEGVLARGLAPLATLAELTLPFARLGGWVLAYKGPRWRQEWEEARPAFTLLGGEWATLREGTLPRFHRHRALLLFRKVAPTPSRYPRRPGLPAKRPLTSAKVDAVGEGG